MKDKEIVKTMMSKVKAQIPAVSNITAPKISDKEPQKTKKNNQ